jgi:MFS family permease
MEQLNTGQLRGSNSAATFPLLLLILIDSMGFGILTPLLAGALAPESDSPISHGFSEDRRYLIYGFATGLYPAMIFLAAPILGKLSDRMGRRTILQVCAASIILGYAVINTAFALGSVVLLMIGRVPGGSRAISMAGLTDVCSPRNKDFWLSMGLLASSGGFVIGSALSGLLADNRIVSWFTIHTPLHATVLVASLDFVLLSLLFRESRGPRSVNRTPLSLASGFLSLASAFRNRALREVSWVFSAPVAGKGRVLLFHRAFYHGFLRCNEHERQFLHVTDGLRPLPWLCGRHAIAEKTLLYSRNCKLEPLATAVLIVASAAAPTVILEWCLILPISITLAVSYAALVILFTDLATVNTKREILGVTAAIKAFAFGTIAFAGGGM